MTQSAARNTAQYITSTFIARDDAVDNQKARATDVVGDDF